MFTQTKFGSMIGVPVLAMLGILTCSTSALAQDRAEFEQLQATTQALIDTLVESGVITREKANQLMATARAKAQAQAQAQAQASAKDREKAQALAQAQAAGTEVGKDGKKVVRVPYVSEAVKNEMRDQIKTEVLAQAKAERWGQASAFPAWLNRFTFEGDFRLREEMVRMPVGNTAPGVAGFMNGDYTRAADIAQNGNGTVLPTFNSQDSFNRMRIRARLAATAKVSEQLSTTLRLTTGNTNDRTSTNQTVGQTFNKYTVVLDQAFVTVRPFGRDLSLMGGRMPNPFFSTDLVWADDLGFEGVAGTLRQELRPNAAGYVTAGYFPLTESRPGTSKSRSLVGVQGVVDMSLGYSGDNLKLGAALYNYSGIAGKKEPFSALGVEREYATRHEYASGFRQRGNSLFVVNATGDTALNKTFGLASNFRVFNLTGVLDLPNLMAHPLRLTGDYVKNLGFKRADILARTGVVLTDGKDHGFMGKVQVGANQISKKGQWNVSMAYRYLGSDAVLDAFTNSDFGLGGTNNKGLILGVNYGLWDNTWASARWMSANPIDSYAPGSNPATKLSVDTIQFELNTKF